MSDEQATTTADTAATPGETAAAAKKGLLARLDPAEHASRLTAVLAVMAAVSSGQYALQVSHTTLAQAEATNTWGYYQAKSIKRNIALSEAATMRAIAETNAEAAEKLNAHADVADKDAARYAAELDGIKASAEAVEAKKKIHNKQGDRFNVSFILLQAGVVLATLATNRRTKTLLIIAGVFGLTGAVLAGSAYLIGLG